MLDIAFEAAFRHLFVYNILFEDSEVDGRYLGLDERSRVLGISAAGCGLASMIRFRPRSIHAVDINRHHLALAGLKMAATREMDDHDALYRMFGHGTATEREIVALSRLLPSWMHTYWQKHHHHFQTSLYSEGLTALMLKALRSQAGLSSEEMKRFVKLPAEDRKRSIRNKIEPALRTPMVAGLLRSPLNLLALGVNFAQRERMLAGGDIVDFIIDHLERVAATDCETNWFAWLAVAGHYNHDHPQAVPPYLRGAHRDESRGAPTSFSFHQESIFDTLASAGSDTWTHYSLCDAVDWMPQGAQEKLLSEILRTAAPGAIVLMRSVEDVSPVESSRLRNEFERLNEESALATAEERSKQYRRVDFFRVNA